MRNRLNFRFKRVDLPEKVIPKNILSRNSTFNIFDLN